MKSLAICLILMTSLAAQEAPREVPTQVIAAWAAGADSIVVGTFHLGWPFPWFDGWHYQSEIEVSEGLLPATTTRTVSVPWVHPFNSEECLICMSDLRELDNQSGIWFLQKQNDRFRVLLSSQLDLRYLRAVKDTIKQRPQSHKRITAILIGGASPTR